MSNSSLNSWLISLPRHPLHGFFARLLLPQRWQTNHVSSNWLFWFEFRWFFRASLGGWYWSFILVWRVSHQMFASYFCMIQCLSCSLYPVCVLQLLVGRFSGELVGGWREGWREGWWKVGWREVVGVLIGGLTGGRVGVGGRVGGRVVGKFDGSLDGRFGGSLDGRVYGPKL